MAFGKTSGGRNFGPNAKIFYFTLKTKDLPEPVFHVQRKEGEDYVTVDDGARFVEGNIIDIQNKEFKHDKKVIKSVSVTMQDTSEGKNEVYLVTIPHTYLGRNILNSLLALKTYEGVQIGVYKSKPKPDKKDPSRMTEGFASSAVRQGGQLIFGRFNNEELPKIPKVQVGDDVHSDIRAITEFFSQHIAEMAKAVKAAAPKPATTSASTSNTSPNQGDSDEGANFQGDDHEGESPSPMPF